MGPVQKDGAHALAPPHSPAFLTAAEWPTELGRYTQISEAHDERGQGRRAPYDFPLSEVEPTCLVGTALKHVPQLRLPDKFSPYDAQCSRS